MLNLTGPKLISVIVIIVVIIVVGANAVETLAGLAWLGLARLGLAACLPQTTLPIPILSLPQSYPLSLPPLLCLLLLSYSFLILSSNPPSPSAHKILLPINPALE